VSSRFELKYILPRALAESVRSFVQPFVRPDRYSARRADLRYPICSLYLDSQDLTTYRMTQEGLKNRFKLRIRTYSDDAQTPAYLEIKKKVDGAILKERVAAERGGIRDLLAHRLGLRRARNGQRMPHGTEFVRLLDRTAARPVVRVRYLREAYESLGGDPVRVTFDTRLHHSVTLDDNISHNGRGWSDARLEGVIFEIKFTDHFPSWAHELVSAFQLQRRSVSKYVMSISEALQRGRLLEMDGRRFAGGPAT
jgi:SPX domain protein involved in polyphosphate accumulation